ncbi:hypothetical protein [Pseudonocardia sp. WMMC193]|uniref:hypothetical protein n=1 Tax=Pseudonocardia sp. WMMC193 TaxID=2911965 RepID=UPI001F3D5416|nr:hypothetical protein [Pseudonocardia sp. WMMC193]MCF7547361.1 hypothetical protein [Pseudonocardia sp. WMMC193]
MSDQLSLKALEDLCLDLLLRLELRPPFTPQELCRRLADERGRPIRLQAADLGATASIGHLVVQPNRDRILYEQSAPTAHQATVIYHEVIHLVRDHLAGQDALTCGSLDTEVEEPGTGASLYEDWQESEAEAGARLLTQLARRRSRPSSLSLPPERPEHGMAAAFGLRRSDWR